MDKKTFEYSKEIVVTTINDKRVLEYLNNGWVMDKVVNSDDGLFFVTFKREIKH